MKKEKLFQSTSLPILVVNVFPVLAFPEDLGLRVTPGLAGQVHPLLLPHDEVIGGAAVDDGGGHLDLEVSPLAPHGVGVDLAHVPAPVHLLHVGDVQLPLLVFPVGEGHALVAGDDAVVDGHNSLSVHSDPGNLEKGLPFVSTTSQKKRE